MIHELLLTLGLLGLMAGGASAGAASPPSASPGDRGIAKPTCRVEKAELIIDPGDFDVIVARDAKTIAVRTGNSAIDCIGPTPTVRTVDAIRLLGSSVAFDLDTGQLEPGRTREAGGDSEIEVAIEARFPEDTSFKFGSGQDRIALWRRDEVVELNLDSRGPRREADVTFVAAEGAIGLGALEISLGVGSDRMNARIARKAVMPYDGFLRVRGGHGPDIVRGGDGIDWVQSGRGSDRVATFAGNDVLAGKDNGQDRMRCGRGDDVAFASPGDNIRGCERVVSGS